MPKTYQLVVSAEAERNIEEALLWIAASNETADVQWYDGLIDAMKALSTLPPRTGNPPWSG